MNKIFSMEYLERCMQVKFIVDNDLAVIHPNLVPLMSMYDSLLLRYLWPEAFPFCEEEIEGLDYTDCEKIEDDTCSIMSE